MNFISTNVLESIILNFSPFFINNYPILMVGWNIFLALLPGVFFYWLEKERVRRGFKDRTSVARGLFFFLLWLAFIPNTAYLMTDIRHLLHYCPADSVSNVCPEHAWKIMFFYLYGFLGWPLLVIFLNQMRFFAAKLWSDKISLILTIILLPLISLGVLLGLLERWNSWSLITSPLAILQNVLRYFTVWPYFWDWFFFTIGLCALYFGGTYLMKDKFWKKK